MAEYIYKIEDEGMLGPIPYVTGRNTGEQIVRCKDCKFYTDKPGLSEEKPERKYCAKYSDWDSEWDVDFYHYVEPDGFCSWGERITANGGDSEVVR